MTVDYSSDKIKSLLNKTNRLEGFYTTFIK